MGDRNIGKATAENSEVEWICTRVDQLIETAANIRCRTLKLNSAFMEPVARLSLKQRCTDWAFEDVLRVQADDLVCGVRRWLRWWGWRRCLKSNRASSRGHVCQGQVYDPIGLAGGATLPRKETPFSSCARARLWLGSLLNDLTGHVWSGFKENLDCNKIRKKYILGIKKMSPSNIQIHFS